MKAEIDSLKHLGKPKDLTVDFNKTVEEDDDYNELLKKIEEIKEENKKFKSEVQRKISNF
jgi:hypothetical protein